MNDRTNEQMNCVLLFDRVDLDHKFTITLAFEALTAFSAR